MRKAIKFCLALAMVGTLAIPAYAADATSKFTGRSTATFLQSTSKEGAEGAKAVSNMDMSASGRFGTQFDVKGEAWNTTAKVELAVNEESLSTRDVFVKVANDALGFTFGRQWITGVAHGEDYTFPVSFGEGAGEHIGIARPAGLKVSLLGPNVNIFYGMDEVANDDDSSTDSQYNRTTLFANWGGEFGAISVDASYSAVSDKIDKNAGGVKKHAADGRTSSEIAFGATYKMDKMGFTLNYSSWATKAGSEGAEALGGTGMDLNFDMAMEGMISGLSVGYTMASRDKVAGGEKKKLDKSAYVVGVEIPVGAASLYVGYAGKSEKGSWEGAKAATASELGATLYYGF